MKKLHHIIAAIDFTPSCRNALREASRRASLDGAAITAVHVMDEFLVHELKKALSADQAAVRAEWLERLKKFVAESEVGAVAVNAEVRQRAGRHPLQIIPICIKSCLTLPKPS